MVGHAKYCMPRFLVAFAIVSSVSVPSDASVWQRRIPCRSPLRHELWQFSFGGALNFTASLLQFWLDQLQAEGLVDVLLASTNQLATLVKAIRL
jgi:hypothetical protein